MKNSILINSHYLSISYELIINNKILHYILFLLEAYLIFIQIMEIYSSDFNNNSENNIFSFCSFTKIIMLINTLTLSLKFLIYFILIFILLIIYFILNNLKIKSNKIIGIGVNITELLFYRLLSLFLFKYLFSFNDICLFINIILTIPYIITLILCFYKNHLFIFIPNVIHYPYDEFSMIIDLHFLPIKIFLSLSNMSSKENISKLFFYLSILILFVLLFYLTYLMIYKSYYFMSNCSLNKVRYSCILTISILIILFIIIGIEEIYTPFTYIFYFNILFLSLLIICYFYDPYQFTKFEKDDCMDNVLYYFFILDREKNKYLLLEEKIEEHISKCYTCNLCKKYKDIKSINNFEEIDLYNIIFNGKNMIFNLINSIVRGIRKNGRNSFINNSYFLINISYIYVVSLIHKDYNNALNSELMYKIINSENSQFLDEYKICLDKIKYTNNFLIKAKKVINYFYEILDEKKMEVKIQKYVEFANLLYEIKYKEMKLNINNNNLNNNEGLPNCNNLLTICSLFYEELYNESISNSGIYIREASNILEDLINNNFRNSQQITLEINIQNLQVKIIRAGGYMNIYENSNLFDLFPLIFKTRQINQLKDLLLNSNNNSKIKENNNNNKNNKNKNKKVKDNGKQYIRFSFIIEQKEDTEIFYNILKLKLSLIFLPDINILIYLNGVYKIDKDIIVTEQKKDEEIILHYGNKGQINLSKNNKNKNDIIISKNKKDKYFGNKLLIRDCNCFIGCKKYNVYHFVLSSKKTIIKNNDKNITKSQINDVHDDKSNLLDYSNKLLLLNDIASITSSNKSSRSRNNYISYNRDNKHYKIVENIKKELIITKYILLISLLILFICIIIEFLFLTKAEKELSSKVNFYLSLKDYEVNYHILFFSMLSLVCIAKSNDAYKCENYLYSITRKNLLEYYQDYNYNDSNVLNFISNNLANISYDNTLNPSSFNFNIFSALFVDFGKLLFIQNQILYESLKEKLEILINYLGSFNNKEFINDFNENISYSKIYQIISNESNKINLYLKEDKITFHDYLLLLTSRFGILTKDFNNLENPIFFLNKTGKEIFNNVLVEKRLNIFQENIYLLILDDNNFSFKLISILNEMSEYTSKLNNRLKSSIYTILSINLFFVFIIIGIIFGYIIIHFIIIYKIFASINTRLNEKFGDILFKDILRKKIDNLKILLSFYENDINTTISNLNIIYNEYHDIYNLKIKEESKSFKKEKKINNINKINCLDLFKTKNNLSLFINSVKRHKYFSYLLFIIIVCLSIYILCFILWIINCKKEDKVYKWYYLCDDVILANNQLTSNLLIMIFKNETLEELNVLYQTKDFISLIYSKLEKLYETRQYLVSISKYLTTTEITMDYDCLEFYQNLDNPVFIKVKDNFKNESEKFLFTMFYFCNITNIMVFKNYKTIYLQLFNRIQIIMENFNNFNYSEIIEFIDKYEIPKIEIIYLITYAYLLIIMYQNIYNSILIILEIIGKNIIITFLVFFAILIFLAIIIYFVYVRNVNKDTNQFISMRKVFKLCNISE